MPIFAQADDGTPARTEMKPCRIRDQATIRPLLSTGCGAQLMRVMSPIEPEAAHARLWRGQGVFITISEQVASLLRKVCTLIPCDAGVAAAS
ncbi:hypothetical protein KCP75_22245 [Salmonella enterica subsp. enterica]|nr:hypothetical protein KCP75_22245 [Salmonella enterica subsp. enterica]